jgi:tRNA threonylcarbamoyladenosine biosynthesis protein TsaE
MAASEIFLTSNASETEDCGELLAKRLDPGDLVLLEGDLAAGKTTFVRGLLRGLGGDPRDAGSPTFVVVQSYRCSGPVSELHHVDLYRLPDSPDALREVGLEEVLADERGVVAVEWPRTALEVFVVSGAPRWRVVLAREDDESRKIEIVRQ